MPPCTLMATANDSLLVDWLHPLGIHQPAVFFTHGCVMAPEAVPSKNAQQLQVVGLLPEEVVPSRSGDGVSPMSACCPLFVPVQNIRSTVSPNVQMVPTRTENNLCQEEAHEPNRNLQDRESTS